MAPKVKYNLYFWPPGAEAPVVGEGIHECAFGIGTFSQDGAVAHAKWFKKKLIVGDFSYAALTDEANYVVNVFDGDNWSIPVVKEVKGEIIPEPPRIPLREREPLVPTQTEVKPLSLLG